MKCKQHPKYKAIYQPKVDCLDCWIMWKQTMRERLEIIGNVIQGLAEREIDENYYRR